MTGHRLGKGLGDPLTSSRRDNDYEMICACLFLHDITSFCSYYTELKYTFLIIDGPNSHLFYLKYDSLHQDMLQAVLYEQKTHTHTHTWAWLCDFISENRKLKRTYRDTRIHSSHSFVAEIHQLSLHLLFMGNNFPNDWTLRGSLGKRCCPKCKTLILAALGTHRCKL